MRSLPLFGAWHGNTTSSRYTVNTVCLGSDASKTVFHQPGWRKSRNPQRFSIFGICLASISIHNMFSFLLMATRSHKILTPLSIIPAGNPLKESMHYVIVKTRCVFLYTKSFFCFCFVISSSQRK